MFNILFAINIQVSKILYIQKNCVYIKIIKSNKN